uniref:Growth arrest and DNA damage inducible alpha n=1 Tax=Canis lupus familiaris TaxID=9615 RepID=A0A8C0RW67_CANLF
MTLEEFSAAEQKSERIPIPHSGRILP